MPWLRISVITSIAALPLLVVVALVGAGAVVGDAQPAGGTLTIPLGASIPSGQIDGVFGSEWDDAATYDAPPFHDFNNESITFPTEFRIKHDGENLYWAVEIERSEDVFAFWFFSMFDKDGDGVVFGDGDDYLIVPVLAGGPPLIDGYVDGGGIIQDTVSGAGTQDIVGAGSDTPSGGGTTYRMEAIHPLNSGDDKDVAWSVGEEVAIVFGALGVENTDGAGPPRLSPAGFIDHVAKNGDENDGNRFLISEEAGSPTATGNSSIIISKEIEAGDPREFCFGSPQLGTFCLEDGESRAFNNLPPGTYTFTEAPVAGWVVTGIGCTPDAGAQFDLTLGTLTVQLEANQTVECGYINSLDTSVTPTPTATPTPTPTPTATPPGESPTPLLIGGSTVTIRKTVLAGDPNEEFEFTNTGPTSLGPIQLAGGEEAEEGLQEGTYVIREMVPAGWFLVDIICEASEGITFAVDIASASVTIYVEDDFSAYIICEFQNSQLSEETGIIRIWKRAPDGDVLDDPVPFTFLPSANLSPEPFNLHNGEYAQFEVAPGEYQVQEQLPDGWRLYTIVCVASDGTTYTIDLFTLIVIIFLGEGDVIDCLYINFPDDGSVIEIQKTVLIGDHFQEFEFEPSPNLSPDNFFLVDIFNLYYEVFFVPPGNYSVRELVPYGWTLYDILCDADSGSSFTVSGTRVDIQLGEGGDVLCDFGNVQVSDTHYKCYNFTPHTDAGATVDLETVFGIESGVGVGDSRYLCPPARKTLDSLPEGDLDSPHIECFDIDSGDDPQLTIELFTQFAEDGFQADVGPATMLCAPVIKRHLPIDQNEPPAPEPPPAPHYKCYQIEGPAAGVAVRLETQFGVEEDVQVGPAVLLCAPALKTHDGEESGLLEIPFLVCHTIDDDPVNDLVELRSQFGVEPSVEVLDPDLLCTPATTAQPRVWGDLTCEGGVAPPAALAVLLEIANVPGQIPPDCPPIGGGASPAPAALSAGADALTWGDINCDGQITSLDAIALLAFIGGVYIPTPTGCPRPGVDVVAVAVPPGTQ